MSPISKYRKQEIASPSWFCLSPNPPGHVSFTTGRISFHCRLGCQVLMALQPYEVCSVALLLRESVEVLLKQSRRLVHSSGMNPFFSKINSNSSQLSHCFLRETVLQSRGRYEVTIRLTFISVAAAGGRMHKENEGQ